MTVEEISRFLYYDAHWLMFDRKKPITQRQELPSIAPTLEQMPKRSWRDALHEN